MIKHIAIIIIVVAFGLAAPAPATPAPGTGSAPAPTAQLTGAWGFSTGGAMSPGQFAAWLSDRREYTFDGKGNYTFMRRHNVDRDPDTSIIRERGTYILAGEVQNQPAGCPVWYEFDIQEISGPRAGEAYAVVFMDREASTNLVELGRPVPLGYIQFNPRPGQVGGRRDRFVGDRLVAQSRPDHLVSARAERPDQAVKPCELENGPIPDLHAHRLRWKPCKGPASAGG